MRPRLAAIAGEAAGEAGLVCRDQRQFQAAQSHHRLATDLAQEAGDHLLGAHELGVWRRAMLTPGRLADDTATSCAGGLFIDEHKGEPLIWRSGAWAGYRAALHLLPDSGLAVAVASNLARVDVPNCALQVLDVFHNRSSEGSEQPLGLSIGSRPGTPNRD
ncbi:MAG: hypothetical protein ACRDJF_12195 [Actinomycetota bacterium]